VSSLTTPLNFLRVDLGRQERLYLLGPATSAIMRAMIRIETSRLWIRNFSDSDWQDLWEYPSDPLACVFEPKEPVCEGQTRTLSEQRLKSDDFLAVALKANQKVIRHLSAARRYRAWDVGAELHIQSNLPDAGIRDRKCPCTGRVCFQHNEGP